MSTNIHLVRLAEDTSFAPLGVLGYCLTQTRFLEPVFSLLEFSTKEVAHSVKDKLQDVLLCILTGCRSIAQVNTRMRPDLPLAQAWHRPRFADQSSLARTLDGFSATQVQQLRAGCEALFRRESLTLRHNFSQWLWLDLDFTSLPISKHAEGSTKGRIEGKKTATGVNWHASMRHSITKPCSLISIRATSRITPPTFQRSKPWIAS